MSVAISQCNNKSACSATCLSATSVTHTTTATHKSVRLRRQMAPVCLLTYTDCIFKNYSKKSLKSNIGCRRNYECYRIFLQNSPQFRKQTLNCRQQSLVPVASITQSAYEKWCPDIDIPFSIVVVLQPCHPLLPHSTFCLATIEFITIMPRFRYVMPIVRLAIGTHRVSKVFGLWYLTPTVAS